tara:strand:- start:11195 stop:11815 length:621 start_codon:yes stop_codon:yes gene_type:complete
MDAIIHQTWKKASVDHNQQLKIDSIKRVYPSYTYMFWTDDDNGAFLKEHYPEFCKFYNTLSNIQKVDFIRYLYIYHFGGLYLDLDVELFSPLIINNVDVVLTAGECYDEEPILDPFFLAGTKKCLFFYNICQSMKNGFIFNILSNKFKDNELNPTFYKTGPYMLTKYHLLNKEKYRIQILSKAFNYKTLQFPLAQGIHYNEQTWVK